jgi:hypothetical protein
MASGKWAMGQTERKYVLFQQQPLPPYRRDYFCYEKAKETIEINGQKVMLFCGEDFYIGEIFNRNHWENAFSHGCWIYEEVGNIQK